MLYNRLFCHLFKNTILFYKCRVLCAQPSIGKLIFLFHPIAIPVLKWSWSHFRSFSHESMDCSDGQLGHQLFHANTEVSTTLVGGFNPSEKYEFVSWGLLFPICGKIKNCSKPATRYGWEFLSSNWLPSWGFYGYPNCSLAPPVPWSHAALWARALSLAKAPAPSPNISNIDISFN